MSGAGPILVVDDSPDGLELTRLVLEQAGYQTRTASTASEALALIARERPSLIVMDLQLPDQSGLEVTRRLKADPATRDIPVIAHTAFASPQDQQSALEAGCDDYLSKPASIQALLDKVAAHRTAPAPPRRGGRRSRR